MFDGSVADEHGYVAMGGTVEPIATALDQAWHEGMSLEECVRTAVRLLSDHGDEHPRELGPAQLEVAVLDRSRPRRTFQRVSNGRLAELLAVT